MRRSRRHTVLAVVGVAAAAAISLPILASADTAPPAPDLRADPAEGIAGPQVYFTSGYGADELLLRFDGFVTNVGQGPLEVSGNPQVPGDVRQRSWGAGEGPGTFASEPVGPARVTFETADGHDHFHLAHAMRYSLWNLDRTAQVAPGQKVGFCLYDIEDAPPPAPPPAPEVYSEDVTEFCDAGHPESTDLRMGTSPGWRDVYDKSLAYQWIDVSNTPPGRYLVGSEADPDNAIWEGGGGGRGRTRPRSPTPAGDRAGLGRPAGGRGPDGRRPDRPARRGQVRRPERRQPALPGDRGAGARHPERRDRGRPSPRPRRWSTRRRRATPGRTRSPTWPARPARPSR